MRRVEFEDQLAISKIIRSSKQVDYFLNGKQSKPDEVFTLSGDGKIYTLYNLAGIHYWIERDGEEDVVINSYDKDTCLPYSRFFHLDRDEIVGWYATNN